MTIRMDRSRLKELRQNAGLSQQELAVRLGLAASTVGMYEQGRRKPDYDTLTRLALFFHVTTDYLLGVGSPAKGRKTSAEDVLEQFVRQNMSTFSSNPISEEEYRVLLEAIRAAVNSVLEKRAMPACEEKGEAGNQQF